MRKYVTDRKFGFMGMMDASPASVDETILNSFQRIAAFTTEQSSSLEAF